LFRKTLLIFACISGIAVVASAQDYKVEASGFFGYTFSEGVPIDPVSIGGSTYNEINPTSGYSYGFTFGVFFTENMEIEFEWTRQDSSLEAKGNRGKTEFAKMKVNNYHANFVYNWGDEDGGVRPYLFGGLGATQYDPGDVMGRQIDGATKFSSTWGGGVKIYPARNVGVKAGLRWTPTYIKSEPGGIWCSPYWPWGCYVVADTQYSNQLEFSGGITFRF
jgi:opacity protein-like surface antigen